MSRWGLKVQCLNILQSSNKRENTYEEWGPDWSLGCLAMCSEYAVNVGRTVDMGEEDALEELHDKTRRIQLMVHNVQQQVR